MLSYMSKPKDTPTSATVVVRLPAFNCGVKAMEMMHMVTKEGTVLGEGSTGMEGKLTTPWLMFSARGLVPNGTWTLRPSFPVAVNKNELDPISSFSFRSPYLRALAFVYLVFLTYQLTS